MTTITQAMTIKYILLGKYLLAYLIMQAYTCVMEQRRDIFQAVADPTRREILSSLLDEPKNVNALAEQFSISRQGVSLHVKVLKECDVIHMSKEGRERYCYIKPEKLLEIIEWLEPFKQLWNDRFDQLENILKNTK